MTKTLSPKLENSIAKLRQWEDAYYNGTPAVADATFDQFKDRVIAELEKECPDHPYLDEVGAPVPDGSVWPKFTHPTVMGSLLKVDDKDDAKRQTKLRAWARGKGTKFFLSEKADGCTIVAYYNEGVLETLATRGNGTVGEDITPNARYFENVRLKLGKKFTGVLRGEGIIYTDRFKKHFSGMANPRNAASGKARDTKNPHLKRHVSVIWFDVMTDDEEFGTWEDKYKFIENFGLKAIPRYPGLSLDDVWKLYKKYVDGKRANLNYWIDGLVVRVSNIKEHDAYGITDTRPKGSRAIKFPAVGVETIVVGVEINRGKGGRFTPVALIKPVQIDGTTVSRVSMHGPDWIAGMDVAIGDSVEVAKAGDIIPQIQKVLKRPANRKKIVFPTRCDLCNIKLVKNGAYIECQNKSCEGEQYGALAKWLDKTGIKGIGDSILQELLADVEDIADLYEADYTVFARAARGSDKLGKKIYRAVQDTRTIELAVFLSGLHIDSLGTTNGQKIASYFKTLDDVLRSSVGDFQKVDGISANATKIVAGLKRKRKLIDRLQQLLDIEDVTEGKLTGLSFCITGRMKSGKKRSAIETWIKGHGGITKGIDRNLSYLVTDDPDSGSAKNEKADKYGVKKITEAQLYQLIDGSGPPRPSKPKVKTAVTRGPRRAVRTGPRRAVRTSKPIRLGVKKSGGLTLFDALGGNTSWIEVQKNKDDRWSIIQNGLTEKGDPQLKKTRLGFSAWSGDVEDLDDGASPQSQKLNVSCHLKWNSVEIRGVKIRAPSIEKLKEALKRITFAAWSEGDL